MSTATLVGVRPVTLEELKRIPCPEPLGRWRPVPHHEVVQHVSGALTDAGYGIEKMDLGVTRADARLFGTAVLNSPLVPGVSLAVGFRSSFDKSISLQWLMGSKVFICGNMAYRSEKRIARKHSVNGITRFHEAVVKAVSELKQFREMETVRIRRMMETEITDQYAESMLLRFYQDEGLLSPQNLHVALEEWRSPQFHEFQDQKTVWRLLNATTFAIGPRFQKNPQVAAAATIRLSSLLEVKQPRSAEMPASVAP